MKLRAILVFALATLLAAGFVWAQAVKVDPAIPMYETTSGISGSLNSVGSDTLNNLMTLWAEGFQQKYPNVRIQIEGKGSSTAPPALISGTSQIGPMSRQMKSSELDEFEKTFGYKPTRIRVAVDALAVFLNKDNPLDELTLQQVDAIFSKGRNCGAPAAITDWGALIPAWRGKAVSLYGRNSASGTYGYFKEHAMCEGDYKDTVKEQPGSASVVQGVTEDLYSIGYSGIGYKTSGVKAISLAKDDGEYYSTEPSDVYSGKYPLARFLYLYINKSPNRGTDPLVREFLEFVLSKEGQEVVVKDGYLPIPNSIVQEERSQL